MQWYYADAGRQVGPLDDAAFEELVRSGVVRDDTPIWREGLANWQAYSTVRPPHPAAPPPPPAPVPAAETGFCTQCGGRFLTGQLTMAGNRQMCPACRQATLVAASGTTGSVPGGYTPGSAPGLGGAAIPASGPLTQFATPVAGDYAVWANRVIGYLIDSIFVLVAMVILGMVASAIFGSAIGLGGLGGLNRYGSPDLGLLQGFGSMGCCCMLALLPVATIAVGLYNKVYLVSQRGFSIGQGVMKIKIVDAQGNKLTFGTAFIRLLAQAGLSFIPFGAAIDLLWPLWDAQRQTLHDKAVGSFAINNPSGL